MRIVGKDASVRAPLHIVDELVVKNLLSERPGLVLLQEIEVEKLVA